MSEPRIKPEASWEQTLDEICPVCERRKGDHTLDEYVKCLRHRLQKLKGDLQ